MPEPTDPIIAEISAQCPDVSTEHVAMVVTAWNAIINGDPVGTVKKDPGTGALALRVSESGVHKWRVTGSDGTTWSDLQPTLPGWESL